MTFTAKRPATGRIGNQSKKPRIFQAESENNSLYSPSKSSPGSPNDARSDGTDITHPSPKGDARRLDVYVCPFNGCGKTYNRPCRLEDHIRSHTDERPYICTHEGCDKAFRRDTHLNRHVKSAHTNERKWACGWEGCGKGFLTNQRLKAHQQVHENAERFRCTEFPPCNQSFRKHRTLQAHIASTHFHKKPFQCTHVDDTTGRSCTHAYETRQKLENHTNRVHGGERFFCTICQNDDVDDPMDDASISASLMTNGAGFKTYNALQTHIKDTHPPVCDPCSLAFSSHRELRRHIDLQHTNLDPVAARRTHACPECPKAFTKSGNLKVHIQTVHRKDRRFACSKTDFSASKHAELRAWDTNEACDAAFTTKQQLETHVRTEHLGLETAYQAKRKQKLSSGDVVVRSAERLYPVTTSARLPILTSLTGVGYEDIRHIACVRAACERRFIREYDLKMHCAAEHGMADSEIAEALQEREALNGGKFWLGGIDEEEEERGDGVWFDNLASTDCPADVDHSINIDPILMDATSVNPSANTDHLEIGRDAWGEWETQDDGVPGENEVDAAYSDTEYQMNEFLQRMREGTGSLESAPWNPHHVDI